MFLNGTKAYEINDMTIQVEFPNGLNSAAKDFLNRPDTKQNLRETIHLACGKEMQIKFVDTKEESNEGESEFEKFIESQSDLKFNLI